MDARNLELAAEFCKLVGAPDLLAYLGLSGEAGADEARQKLKARRRHMQGMQGNPKYKHEALYLIKHFAALDAVLAEPAAYLADARRRAESVHTPILEMTVRGVLAGGSLTLDQEAYLRRNALELGVSEQTFDALLDRLAREAGVPRPVRTPGAVPPRRVPPGPEAGKGNDFYRILGVSPSASPTDIEAAWRERRAQLDRLPPSAHREDLRVRLDLAWNVLRDRAAREQYDLASSRTGPPARARTHRPPSDPPSVGAPRPVGPVPGPPDTPPRLARPDLAATAPPVRQRSHGPNSAPPSLPPARPPRLEVHGEPSRALRVFGRPVTETIAVRNIGDEPLQGTLTTDVPWLRVSPQRIDPDRKEQAFQVVVDPDALSDDRATGRVRIATDAGEAFVEFEIRRVDPRLAAAMTLGAAFAALIVLVGLGALLFRAAGPGSSGLTIRVDPAATDVRLDGRSVGSGSLVVVQEPPLGTVTLTVEHPNFAAHSREVVVERGRAQEVEITLELTRAMDFRPTRDMTRGQIDPDTARSVMDTRGAAIEACLAHTARVGQILTGTVRVHVDREGRGAGFEVQGRQVDDPQVRGCLARQAAAVTFDPLEQGDYATVRYDYTVTADPSNPP